MKGQYLPSFSRRRFLAAVFAGGLFLAGCGDDSPIDGQGGEEKPRVFIVHSYDNGFRWTAEQQRGILEGLKRSGFPEENLDLRVFYMDTRVNFLTDEQIAHRAQIAFRTIEEFKPDVVIVTDDIAAEEVAVAYLQEHPDSTISFLFSGVNGAPETYPPVQSLDVPGVRLSGTVERVPFRRSFDAAKRVFGSGLRNVVILADDSLSSSTVLSSYRSALLDGGADYPLRVVNFIQISSYEDWKDTISLYEDRTDAFAVLSYHRLKDQGGNIVQPKEVAKWTVENSTRPVFGLISDWSADGFAMSYGNSGFDTGVFIGQRGAEALKGQDVGMMPIVDPNLYEMTFNKTTIEKLDLEIPEPELIRASELFE